MLRGYVSFTKGIEIQIWNELKEVIYDFTSLISRPKLPLTCGTDHIQTHS